MNPSMITLHCTDSANGKPIPMEEIRRWHTDPPPKGRGWKDIGYHLVIQPDGSVDRGRGFRDEGAHVEGHNAGNLGIVMLGKDRFTLEQFDALKRQWDFLRQLFPDIAPWAFYCHRDWDTARKQGKTCPNMDSKRLLAWLLTGDIRAIAPYLLNPAKS